MSINWEEEHCVSENTHAGYFGSLTPQPFLHWTFTDQHNQKYMIQYAPRTSTIEYTGVDKFYVLPETWVFN